MGNVVTKIVRKMSRPAENKENKVNRKFDTSNN